MNYGIILYIAGNKFAFPQKSLVTKENVIEISENDFVFIYLTTPKPFINQSFIWLSNFQFSLTFDKFENGLYHYSLLLDYFFGYREKEIFSSSFKVDGVL